MKVLNYHRLTVIFINKTYIPSDHQTKCSRVMPRLFVRIHRTFLYNIDIVYIGELASLPLFHLRYLTFGSSGKETSKLCPFGTTENRLDS